MLTRLEAMELKRNICLLSDRLYCCYQALARGDGQVCGHYEKIKVELSQIWSQMDDMKEQLLKPKEETDVD